MKLKGSEKRIVCMKSAGSRLFCEAFFVLRDDAPPSGEQDMLREANRILEENILRTPPSRHTGWAFLLAAFLLGAIFSALGFLLVGILS
jgi:hypothetical protein